MSRRELALFTLAMLAWFVGLVFAFDDLPHRFAHAGDNRSYVRESSALRGHPLPDSEAEHFLGYPMATAGVAAVLRVSDWAALVIVSAIASLAAVLLAGELWGTAIAAWFAILNLDWVQRAALGGAEPLFALLIFAAIVETRRERWLRATGLAALATLVRPLGICLLIAIGVQLLRRRRLRALASAVAIGVAVAVAYLAIVARVFGDPFANFAWYRMMGLGHELPFIPYVSLFASWTHRTLTLRNAAKAILWTTVVLLAIVAAVRRGAWREHRIEWLFGALYVASFLFFPAWWIEAEMSRYLTPVIPLMLVALAPWVPRNRGVIWTAGFALVAIAAIKHL